MRLIDADDLKAQIQKQCDICRDKDTSWCEHCCNVNDWEEYIDNAPTINPEELKPLINKIIKVLPDLVNAAIEHLPEYIAAKIAAQDPKTVKDNCPLDYKTKGKWIEHSEGYNICNCCTYRTVFSYKYCPNCGAYMKGEN